MYPNTELRHLEERKRRLLNRIERRREECVRSGEQVGETLRMVDGWREKISNWTGFASVFFPFFLKARAELGKPRPPGKVAGALRLASLGWKLVKGLKPLTYVFRGG